MGEQDKYKREQDEVDNPDKNQLYDIDNEIKIK